MKITQIFKEANGNWSATRVVFVCSTAAIVSVWAFLSIRAGAIQPMQWELTAFVGTLSAGKVIQKPSEALNEQTEMDETEG